MNIEKRKIGYSKRIYAEVGKLIKKSTIFLVGMIVGMLVLAPMCWEAYQTGREWFTYLFAFAGIMGVVLNYRDLAKFSNVLTNVSKNELEFKDTGLSGVYTNDPKVASNEKYISLEYSQIDRVEVKEPNVGDIKFMGVYHNLFIYCDFGLVKFCVDDANEVGKRIEAAKKQDIN